MGIRIHKVLGYGLTDVQYDTDNWKMVDPRFNKKGFMALGCEEQEEEFTNEGFDKFLAEEAKKEKECDKDNRGMASLQILKHLREEETKDLERVKYTDKDIFNKVIYDPEFGSSEVVVFQPVVFGNDWQRYDDTIDYYDPANHPCTGGPENGVILIDRAIYPFEWLWDVRTNPPTSLTSVEYQMYNMTRSGTEHAPKIAQTLADDMNFDSVEELHDKVRPIIPEELIILLKYLKIFEKEEYIYDLKPMLYSYWA
jgi:hypothetical protein